ncbi:MAG: hypothetical protein WC969_08425 [Elusimicrobiota bacterium]
MNLLLALFLPLAAAAAEPQWKLAGSSLLLVADGAPAVEFGLGTWEEEKGALVERRSVRGGLSKDGRFAWHWTRVESIQRRREDTVLSSSNTLSYYGREGRALWSAEDADAPAGRAPLLMGDDGEFAVVFSRRDGKWRMSAYSFAGRPLVSAELDERLAETRMTPSGRFVLAAWSPREKPLMLTLLDLRTRSKCQTPAASLPPLTQLVLTEDGELKSGERVAYRFKR